MQFKTLFITWTGRYFGFTQLNYFFLLIFFSTYQSTSPSQFKCEGGVDSLQKKSSSAFIKY